ncbi:hypothetical protein JIY74_30045 [Vibrio harveyi]|nr:hypothetical protein [Vibrio harveyi]
MSFMFYNAKRFNNKISS